MRVVIVGTGNVATVLGKLIKNSGHDVLQVIGHTIISAQTLATQLNCAFTDNSDDIDTTAHLYLVAVTDTAIEQINNTYRLQNKLVVHTAGAVSKEALKNTTCNYGVLYPLQSLRKENTQLHEDIPLLIDAANAEALTLLNNFAHTISGKVSIANDQLRFTLHVAAVLVSNFTNHLYAMAADFCDKEGANFTLLLPLIEETALRLRHHTPREMLTGPAVRKDIKTIQQHLRLLAAYPGLQNIYQTITDSIMASTRTT